VKILKFAFASSLMLAPVLKGQQVPLPFFHPHDVIVFQGDSITDGGRLRTGQDYNHIMGQDYAYILAAEIGAEYPDRNLGFINRGIGGEGVPDLAARWQTDTIDLHPNLLSILVGVNDTFAPGPKGETASEFEQNYDRLLSQTLISLPTVKIILGEPFLLPVGKFSADYSAQRAMIKERQDAVERLARKYNLALVKYQDIFDDACKLAPADHWSWDGVHPTYAGHWLMTRAWLAAAATRWPNG
jgi:lysophospholipase L1-like esterase